MVHFHTMKTILYFYLALLTAFSHAGGASKNITMATVEWPPFFSSELDKGGFVSEIARQALHRKGYTMEIDFMPWKRAEYLTRNGDYNGLFGCWVNNDIRKNFSVSTEIMASGDGHFLVPSSVEGPVDLQPEDLAGKKVGIVRGYAVSESLGELMNSGTIVKFEVSRVKQLLDMIKWENRVDIILENYLVAEYYHKKYFPGSGCQLKKVGKDALDGGLYVCWSNSGNVAQEVRRDFDDAIREMRKDGTITGIEKEFGIE